MWNLLGKEGHEFIKKRSQLHDRDCPNAHIWPKPLQFFGTRSSMILKLGIDHQGLKVNKVYMNDDPGLTVTYLTARSNLVKIAHCAYMRPIVR